jgi:hypothetical protein
MIININDLKPVTVREIINDDKDLYEVIKDGYEWDGIFISNESKCLSNWFLDEMKRYSKIEKYAEVLPRKADNLHIEIIEHDEVLNEDYFNIIEDENPENTAIKLYNYRVFIAFQHNIDGHKYSVVTHDNSAMLFENDEKAINYIENWINVRLWEHTPKATYYISRKDNEFEKRGELFKNYKIIT